MARESDFLVVECVDVFELLFKFPNSLFTGFGFGSSVGPTSFDRSSLVLFPLEIHFQSLIFVLPFVTTVLEERH